MADNLSALNDWATEADGYGKAILGTQREIYDFMKKNDSELAELRKQSAEAEGDLKEEILRRIKETEEKYIEESAQIAQKYEEETFAKKSANEKALQKQKDADEAAQQKFILENIKNRTKEQEEQLQYLTAKEYNLRQKAAEFAKQAIEEEHNKKIKDAELESKIKSENAKLELKETTSLHDFLDKKAQQRKKEQEDARQRVKDANAEEMRAKAAAEDAKNKYGEDSVEYAEASAKAQAAEEDRKAAEEDNKKKNNLLEQMKDGLMNIASNMLNMLDIDKSIAKYNERQVASAAALQGSIKSFSDITENIQKNAGMSALVLQEDILDNVAKMANDGIIYNIEERAFLETIKDNIISSIDLQNDGLLRLIRLQQSDSTAFRLGLASNLRTALNESFNDSSYMKNLYNTISSAIVEANSQLPFNDSLEFEYAIQKWMGALSSVGVSNDFITTLAKGLNYLSTGNVTALSNDSALQSLFAMSVSRSGSPKSYADMLKEGLNASDVNNIMRSMVLYLQEIAQSTDNLVVKSAYGNIFGFNLSDLTGISNLLPEDISSLYSAAPNAASMYNETQKQLSLIPSRTPISKLLSNVVQNTQFTLARGIADTPASYAIYLLNKYIEEGTGGGISVPIPLAFGTGIPTEININRILDIGLLGYSAFSQLPSILSALSNIGSLSLGDWGSSSQMRVRGQGFSGLDLLSGTSSFNTISQSIATGNTGDIKSQTLQQQAEEAQGNKEITSQLSSGEYSSSDIFKALFEGEKEEITAKVNLANLDVSEIVTTLTNIQNNLDSLYHNSILAFPMDKDNARLDSLTIEGFKQLLEQLKSPIDNALSVFATYTQ